jgi:NADH-quinone oxidoreductase subunit M
MPLYAAVFLLFSLASVGLPGTSGFVGEVLVIVGVFEVNSWVALLAATGGFLSVAYMLWLYRRVIFGALVKDELKMMPDLRANEIIAFAPLVILTILMGIYPDLFLDPMRASVDHLMVQIDAAPAAALASR